ncbi:unnamed protein product, partial [Brenthis ino]
MPGARQAWPNNWKPATFTTLVAIPNAIKAMKLIFERFLFGAKLTIIDSMAAARSGEGGYFSIVTTPTSTRANWIVGVGIANSLCTLPVHALYILAFTCFIKN